jgi:hypothetical protein
LRAVLARSKNNLEESMKKFYVFSLLAPLVGAAATFPAGNHQNPLVVTASNATQNQLLVYNTAGMLMQTVSTQGQGGVGGNSGGIAARGNLVAVVNFGSKSVSVFQRDSNSFHLKQTVPAVSAPVSVAFSADHLYILGTMKVESHRMFGSNVNANPDGVASLLKADGSSAQVGVVGRQLIITEKSNAIETVNLLGDGSVTGFAVSVANIPGNVDTPFGLVTRGNNAYVTIAHADETSLVRNGAVLTVTPSGTQHSPCWLALVGPFLYASNSPSMTVSRYAVYGQKIVQDAAVAAQLNGAPTDIASGDGWVAVIDGSGQAPNQVSHLSIFTVDEDGNLTRKGATTIRGAANGVAVVGSDDENDD